jgi:hypothetical protein
MPVMLVGPVARIGTRSTHTGPLPSADDACRPCAARSVARIAYCQCAAQAALVRHNLPSCAARARHTSAAQSAPIGAVPLTSRARMRRHTMPVTSACSMITPRHAQDCDNGCPLILRRWLAAARGVHRRNARSRAALVYRYRICICVWLHKARCGAGCASVAAARVGRGRSGGARLC